MTGREWPRLLAGALVLAVLTAWVVAHWRVRADITHFLPGGERDDAVLLARQIALGELSRSMVLVVDAGDGEAAAISREFEAALRADPVVSPQLAALDGGPSPEFEPALWQLYQPRRFGFAAADPEAARARVDDAGLERTVADLKRRLASPLASLLSRVAPEDPFLIVPDLFDRVGGRGDGVGIVAERFVTTDGGAAVLFLTTRASSSDTTVQRPLLTAIRTTFAALNARHGGGLQLRLTGTNRHAVAAEDAIVADIGRVSIGSTLGLLAVFLLLFTSLRLPLSWLPVLASGFVVGAASCLLAFGEIHGMTIAFGASLIGVSIDYAVHFYCHQSLAPAPGPPRATLRRVWPGLLLGCATTVVGFIVLLIATFPGLRELALFSAAGLFASLLAAWAFLPGLVGPIGSTRVTIAVVGWLVAATAVTGRRRLWWSLPLLLAAIVSLLGFPRAVWNDRIANLNRSDPAIVAEDAAVMRRVVRHEQRRLVVVVAADAEQALAGNERVARALAAATASGELAGYRSVAAALPSAASQQQVAAAFTGDQTLWQRLQSRLTDAGFVAERFEPFRDALRAPAAGPITPDLLLGSALAGVVRPFLLPLDDGRYAVLSFLNGIGDQPALAARLQEIPGARLLDIEGALTGAFAAYRERMATLLAVGILAVVGLVVLRYRRLHLVVLAVVPALLGAAATIATMGLLDIELTMLSLVALLMVVSMGVDYGIFLAEDESHPGARGATLLGVVVDGVTTILGFGLLAISSHPALFGIGVAAGMGVTWCLVLALAFGALVAGRRQTR
ncbi:MAG: MMPL family transporter [Planctomycetes bacterium]|nr:MMPL family transporter [Planctomycetota bacterium]